MVATKQVRWANVMDFKIARLFGGDAAMLAGCPVSLDSPASLSAPVAAVVGMSPSTAAIGRIISSGDRHGATFNRAIEVFVFGYFRGRQAILFAAAFARYKLSGVAAGKPEFSRTAKATENMIALFLRGAMGKGLTTVFASHVLSSILRTLGGNMGAGTKDIINAEAFNSPALYFDRLAAIVAARVQFVIRANRVLLALVPFDPMLVGTLDNSPAAAIA